MPSIRCLPLQRSVFDNTTVYAGFVVSQVAVGEVILRPLWLSVPFYQSHWYSALNTGSFLILRTENIFKFTKFLSLSLCLSLSLSLSFSNITSCLLLNITNKMQHYTIFFIIDKTLHVSGGFSAHHQELKNCTHSIGYVPGLLAATATGSSKQAWHIPDAVCTVFELLMMGGKTARNM